MFNRSFTQVTTTMIYLGTLLLSVLSFFTTFAGMSILLNTPLAIVGSLGLQIAMLGIAWNLMKIKEHRGTYAAVFCVAAAFSIIFSYANFDTNLKASSRQSIARTRYADASHAVLSEYAGMAREAALKGRYQVQRLGELQELEEKKGWATVIDEGSGDPFVQSVIDGARVTVEAWERHRGVSYRQGKGQGIILSYFKSRLDHASGNLAIVDRYILSLDSLATNLNSESPVAAQHAIVNKAWYTFPSSEINLLSATSHEILPAPNRAEFPERPATSQQAFKLVIDDLLRADQMALFALLLAIAIDLIVILMAFAGSYIVDDVDYLFDRVRQDTASRIKSLSFNDANSVSSVLDGSLERFRHAGKFGLELSRVIGDYYNNKTRFKVTMKREAEDAARGAASDHNREAVIQYPSPDQRTDIKNRMTITDADQQPEGTYPASK